MPTTKARTGIYLSAQTVNLPTGLNQDAILNTTKGTKAVRLALKTSNTWPKNATLTLMIALSAEIAKTVCKQICFLKTHTKFVSNF